MLKTLKDLINKRNREMKKAGLKLSHPKEMPISPRVLRKEAINHIKFLENEDNCKTNLTKDGSFLTSEREAYAIKYWIKTFFNIKEEDL